MEDRKFESIFTYFYLKQYYDATSHIPHCSSVQVYITQWRIGSMGTHAQAKLILLQMFYILLSHYCVYTLAALYITVTVASMDEITLSSL